MCPAVHIPLVPGAPGPVPPSATWTLAQVPGLGGFPQQLSWFKNPSANAGDARDSGSIPGLGRSPVEGNGDSLQSSCLENLMDRGAWWATVHGVAESQTRLSMHTRVVFPCVILYLPSRGMKSLCQTTVWPKGTTVLHAFLIYSSQHCLISQTRK